MNSNTKQSLSESAHPGQNADTAAFTERVRNNQQRLASKLKSSYDFVVCGSGSAGSVVAGRLAENPDVRVLLLEAGGSDDVPSVTEANQSVFNLGSERDWNFRTQPNPHLNGRSIRSNMGKVLGGGSSINAMVWSRGHKNDWDCFAAETGDAAWNYQSVLNLYRRVEDWHGAPDPEYRGAGGPVFVQPARDPNPVGPAMIEAARSVGIPSFESPNGRMMEGQGGASLFDLLVRDGKRQSIFRAYTFPYMDRPNLTVLTYALVTRIALEGKRATGVEFVYNGQVYRIGAELEVVLSLGAIHTPKVLMLSGIGDQADLQSLGIPIVQHLPGVGRNFQDHLAGVGCVWEYQQPLAPRNNGSETTFFWKSDPALDRPDLQPHLIEAPVFDAEARAKFKALPDCWTLLVVVTGTKSRGQVRLTSSNPDDPILIEPGTLSHPDDLKAAMAGVELCREVGNSAPLRCFVKREVLPGNLKGQELENFIRQSAETCLHQTCTSKMGRDSMSVVDGNLNVYGIDNLRVADGSIMPRVTTGNTMAPCVIIGERAGEMLKAAHGI